MESINYYVELFAAIIVLVLLLGCIMEKKYSRDPSEYYWKILISAFIMLVSDAHAAIAAASHPVLSMALYVFYTLSFYAILYYFACYLIVYISQYVSIPSWIQRSVNWLCCLFCDGWIIYGFVQRQFSPATQTVLFWVGQIGSVYIYVILMSILFRNRNAISRRAFYGFLSFPVLPLVAILFRILWPGGCFLQLAITVSLVLVHTFVRVGLIFKIQDQELQLSRDRIHIASRQIQPHFLYNVLNSIYALCEIDPSTAQTALADFSEYLRVILDNLENDEAIPIRQEIAHVRHYLDLEKMRFRDALNIEIELAATNFSVPPLSVQPFVENAVNHGLMVRNGGGTLSIRTWNDDGFDCIEIRDDGVGFDTGSSETHVGIDNAVHRLKAIVHADVRIESAPGEGTTVTIRIPRGAESAQTNNTASVLRFRK